MKMRLLLLSALFILTKTVSAQFEFNYPKTNPTGEFEKLFVRMDNSSKDADELKGIITDFWKACPVEIIQGEIKPDDLKSFNLFLNLKHDSMELEVVKSLANPNAPVIYKQYYYLNFSTLGKLYDSKKSADDNLTTILRAELFEKSLLKEKTERTKENIALSFSSLDKEFLNGTKGVFKNIIQYANGHLKGGKNKKLFDEVIPTAEIKNLLNDTLFIPYYVGSSSEINTASPEYKSFSKLLKGYSYKSKLISREELSDKIISAKSNFYYLNYIQSSETEKIVSVINGNNGEVIYSVSTLKSGELKEKDLVEIVKAIKE